MNEKCNFCQKAVDEFNKGLGFENEKDRVEVIAQMILAYGSLFECGEDRLTCIPLKKLYKEVPPPEK